MKLTSFTVIVAALKEAGVRYLVAGGLAVNAHGYLPFEEEYERALVKPLRGPLDVRFVSIRTLIRMKELAGRPQDLIDIEYLRIRFDDDAGK